VREFLNMDEIQRIVDHDFKFNRHSQVRDIFLFCCFTGLAYAVVMKLKKTEILTDDKAEKWISIYRENWQNSTLLLSYSLFCFDKFVS
jgi:hypothetical protein